MRLHTLHSIIMKLQYPILFLFLGFALMLFGALLKLESRPYAIEMLTLGLILDLVGMGMLLFRYFKQKSLE